jgi:phosphate-selective porin OprO/OprP
MKAFLRSVSFLACVALILPASAILAAEGDAKPGVDISLGKKGLQIQTTDGEFKFKAGGRLHLDAAGHPGDLPLESPGVETNPANGVELRRARMYLGATVYRDWDFYINVEFADNEVAIKDALISWNGLDWARVTAGSQKQPYSLDLEMSSNDMPFVERGVDNALIVPFVDRAIGGRFDAWGEHWMVGVGVYGDGVDPNEAGNEGWGAAGRAIYTPILTDTMITHIGFRGAYREPAEADQTYRVRSETTHFSNLFITDTGESQNEIGGVTLYGPEAAFAWGPASLWGEYNRAEVNRSGASNLSFQSGYVAAAYSLTGESRAASYKMKDSEFKRLNPARPFRFRSGGIGAWEVAMRYAYLDVNDKDVNGGAEGRLSTSLNWYPIYNVRFMFDWTRVLNTEGGSLTTRTAVGLDILTLRASIAF